MKKIIFLVLLVCAFGIASPTIAQDTSSESLKCDMPTLQSLMDKFSEALQKVKDAKPTDPIKVSNVLQTMANLANDTRAACDGLAFSGNKQQVLGPVTIPVGIYRAKATTSGAILVDVTVTDGECGSRTSGEQKNVFALNKDEAKDGAEAVFTSKGCTALIQVSLVDAPWQLDFERISTD